MKNCKIEKIYNNYFYYIKPKMPKIYVKVVTIKSKNVIEEFNKNRPEGSLELRRADVAEGGFEIPLTKEELKLSMRGPFADYNYTVRQVRWYNGELRSGYYIPFTEEETLMLYEALKTCIGADNVELI